MPRCRLSITTVTSPGWAMMGLRDWTTSMTPPLAGGCGPLNVPLVASIVGTVVLVSGFPARSNMVVCVVTLVATLVAVSLGVTDLVFLGDSRLLGPDWNELISKAVTE